MIVIKYSYEMLNPTGSNIALGLHRQASELEDAIKLRFIFRSEGSVNAGVVITPIETADGFPLSQRRYDYLIRVRTQFLRNFLSFNGVSNRTQQF